MLIALLAVHLLVSFYIFLFVHNALTPGKPQLITNSSENIPLKRIVSDITTYASTSIEQTTYNLVPIPTAPDNQLLPMKTILLWNSFFEDDEYHFGLGQEPFITHHCAVSSCRTTNDHSQVDIADAILFHTPKIGPLPNYRSANQKYVFVQREPHYPKSKQLLHNYYDMFNLTMTYRYDSDIVIPYGKVVNRTYLSLPYNHFPPENKTSQIVWVVSHCHTLGRRERYIAALQKHISIDIYGECGNLTCDKSELVGCMDMFETRYR